MNRIPVNRLFVAAVTVLVVGSGTIAVGAVMPPPADDPIAIESYLGDYRDEDVRSGTGHLGGGSGFILGRGNYTLFLNASRAATIRIYSGVPNAPGEPADCPSAMFEDVTYRFLGWDEPPGFLLLGASENVTTTQHAFGLTAYRLFCYVVVDFGSPSEWTYSMTLLSYDAWSVLWGGPPPPTWASLAKPLLIGGGVAAAVVGLAVLVVALVRMKRHKQSPPINL